MRKLNGVVCDNCRIFEAHEIESLEKWIVTNRHSRDADPNETSVVTLDFCSKECHEKFEGAEACVTPANSK